MKSRALHPREQLHIGLLIALVNLPHFIMQTPWFAALLGALLLIYCTLSPLLRSKIPRWLSFVLALLTISLVYQSHQTLIGRDGGVAVLVALSVVKLYETRTLRDAHAMILLALFATGVGFLQGQAPWQAALALVASCAIFSLAIKLESPSTGLGISIKTSSRLLLEAIPIAVLLFVLFPRLPAPLWATPSEKIGLSGLSGEQMTPGSISQLIQDDSIAFRVEFFGNRPSQDQLYWRGPVFEQFNGVNWLPAAPNHDPKPSVKSSGEAIAYEITLEANQQKWLLALDLPTQIPNDAALNSRLVLLRNTPVTQRVRYRASSTLSWQTGQDQSVTASLQLPNDLNPKSRALAETWLSLPPEQRVSRALEWLGNNRFAYTLYPPLLSKRDRIDEFLFDSKRGFCEHFASSFTVLMRAAGVPARVVTGYQGGLLNPSADYFIIRQADAHAWVEVWLAGRGWQRVDPTFIIAPARIESGLSQSVNTANLPMMLRQDNAWLRSLRLNLDVFVNHWNQWVIGYDEKKQLDFLQKLGIDDLLSLSLWLGAGLLMTLGSFALWLILSNRPPAPDQASLLFRRYCKTLKAQHLIKAQHETALQFSLRCQRALPELQSEIAQITQFYLAARYADDADALARLTGAVQQFKPRK